MKVKRVFSGVRTSLTAVTEDRQIVKYANPSC